mmetsp:Transcript_33180/g.62452  ORF Transcript_33180/g.62452 Transcript_33180/m.62452 type:complete len:132 (+) Transcript_33180:1-396(+)
MRTFQDILKMDKPGDLLPLTKEAKPYLVPITADSLRQVTFGWIFLYLWVDVIMRTINWQTALAMARKHEQSTSDEDLPVDPADWARIKGKMPGFDQAIFGVLADKFNGTEPALPEKKGRKLGRLSSAGSQL